MLPIFAAVLHQHVGVGLALGLAALGVFAGWLGAVVGIGGGVVIVPALVLLFGFDTRVAVAASLVAVVATSAAAGSAYAGAGQTNMRLALVLEIATTLGGVAGGLLAVAISPVVLDGLFGAVMLVTAGLMLRGRDEHGEASGVGEASGAGEASSAGATGPGAPATVAGAAPAQAGQLQVATATAAKTLEGAPVGAAMAMIASGERTGWEERGHLGGAYFDQARGELVTYTAVRRWIGWSVSFLAGLLSGLLGVGGGFLKVPAMHLGMRVPIKVAAATSNFMIGVTAVASLFVYFTRGYVLPFAAAPVALGIAVGAYGGARSSGRFSSTALARILAVVLLFVAVQMGLKAFGVTSA